MTIRSQESGVKGQPNDYGRVTSELQVSLLTPESCLLTPSKKGG
jgi:hypothetical protein